MSRSWVSPLLQQFYPWHLPIRRRTATAKRRRPALLVEALEARWLPSAFMVMDNSDNGSDSVSLRYLLGHVAAGSTIDFAPSIGSITLTTGTLTIGTSVQIVNDKGVGPVTISGADSFTVFTVNGSTTATLSGLTIADGNAGNGGGILNNGTLTVNNSTLSDDSAGYGGGIVNFGTLTVSNSTLSNDSATYGGGIFNGGSCTVSSSTLSGNSASQGGGIANVNGGSATLDNTIVANSTSGGDLSGDSFAGAYDLIGDGSDSASFSHVLTGNPLLAALGNYGGPTQTLALLPGSPAIHAGESITGITTDQRGLSLDSPPDIGAFQAQGFNLVVSGGSSDSIAVSSTASPIPPERAAVFDPTTASWIVDNAGTGDPSPTDSTFTFGLPGDTAVIGDWNGAGFDEIGVYRVDAAITDPVSGKHPLIFSLNVSGTGTYDQSAGDVSFIFGLQDDTVIVGDWLGNGKDEIGVVRAGNNAALVWSLNLSTGDSSDYVIYQFGLYDDKPVVGEWSGGSKTEIGTVRTVGSDLVWSLNFSGTGIWSPAAGDMAYTFGLAGDIPIVGDWSGAGSTEIGTYRVAPNGVGLDFSLDSSGSGVFSVPLDSEDYFGRAPDGVIVGDWNGSGKTNIATYRLASDGQHLLFTFDTNGDGVFDAGDVASQIGILGGPSAKVLVGQWKQSVAQ